jgi:lysophospholipase L1-like esterase
VFTHLLTRPLRISRLCLKWTVSALVLVEIACFVLITTTNLALFGSIWKGGVVRYDPYAEFLNVKGVRPTAYNPSTYEQEKEKAKHIWILGGSTARGDGVPYQQTMPSNLALRLNEPGKRQPVLVINFGENTFNSVMETKYLQKLLMQSSRPPDLVVFYDGVNDSIYFNEYRIPDPHYAYRRLQGPIESYRRSVFGLLKPLTAALYTSFTLETYDRLSHTVTSLDPDDPALREAGVAIQRRYAHVQRMSASYGAKLLVFWQPLLWVETDKVNPSVTEQEKELAIMKGVTFLKARRNIATTYGVLATHLREQPYFVNFQNILTSRTQPAYSRDGIHLNAEGNHLVAEAMARVLRERSW